MRWPIRGTRVGEARSGRVPQSVGGDRARRDDDVEPAARELDRARATDAAARTGHERDLPVRQAPSELERERLRKIAEGVPLVGDGPPTAFSFDGLIRDERGVRLAPDAED